MTLAEAPLQLMLVGLVAYAVFGGADFGAAFWQLGARGARGEALRQHAYRAMGPVWETNHVWLVFVLVVCWTAYPTVFASVFSTLTGPLFAAGIGIVLRGTAYAVHAGTAREIDRRAADGIFSASSILTPFALGAAIGGIASGRVPVGNAAGDPLTSWLNPTSLATGTLFVASGAYLAAVYLAADAARAGLAEVAGAYRVRALAAGAGTGAVALAALGVVAYDAPHLRQGLLAWPATLAVVASSVAGAVTLELVRRRRLEPARYVASGAVAAIVVGWALAQRPEILQGLTVTAAAAGRETLIATVVAGAAGAAILMPSLVLLFVLVLRGRFDPEAYDADVGARQPSRPERHLPLLGLATAAGAAALPLTLVFNDGLPLALGVVLLLLFLALAWLGLASAIATHVAGDQSN